MCVTELEEGEGRESGVGGGGGVPQVVNGGKFSDDEDSHFFAYFLTIMVTAIIFYLVFHNKQRVSTVYSCGQMKPTDMLETGPLTEHRVG